MKLEIIRTGNERKVRFLEINHLEWNDVDITHFGCTKNNSDEEIIDAAKEWLVDFEEVRKDSLA